MVNVFGQDEDTLKNMFQFEYHWVVLEFAIQNTKKLDVNGEIFYDYHFNSKNSLVEFEIYNIIRLNVVAGMLGRIIIGGHLSRTNQKRQWKNVLANFCNFFNKNAEMATKHTITYNWDSDKESLGEIKENETIILTEKINSYRSNPLGFGFTENKLW